MGEISQKPIQREIPPPQTTKCEAGAIVRKKEITEDEVKAVTMNTY